MHFGFNLKSEKSKAEHWSCFIHWVPIPNLNNAYCISSECYQKAYTKEYA